MTLIYAHRGAKREAAENTRSAFDKALAYPIDGMETDIQLSRDGECVLWHDDDLGKLGLPGMRIDDFGMEELRGMDVAVHFAGAHPLPNPLPQAGEGANEALRAMPSREGAMSLREFVSTYRPRCGLLLEIKRYPGEPEAQQQAKIRQTLELAGTPQGDRVLASSFDLESLVHAHRIAPDFPLVFNLEPEHDATFAQRALNEQPWLRGLCVHRSTLDAGMMAVARQHDKLIAVYTCNSDADIQHALTLGVDVLISDVPQHALQMRDA